MTHTQDSAPRCETCRWWCGKVSGKVYYPGECRRYPPTIAPDDKPYNRSYAKVWPVMSVSDWCGEHSPRATLRTEGDET